MKRLPIVAPNDAALAEKLAEGGRVYTYQTLAERDGDPAVEAQRVREFAGERPFEPPPGVDRRTFMTLMGASMALGGLAACRRPEEKILPYTRRPEDVIDGRPVLYATSIPMYGTSIGLLVESNDGRPTKIEGNPEHPESLGGTTTFVQATLLDLYDPDRSKSPKKAGQDVSHEEAWKFVGDLGRGLRSKKGRGLGILVEEHCSPTTRTATAALIRDMPDARVYRYEPFGRENARAGAKLAFGKELDPVPVINRASVLVVLDGDILGTESSPIKNSKHFASRRRAEDGVSSRIYVAEPAPTVTGNAADHRLRIQARQVADLAKSLAAALAKHGVDVAAELAQPGAPLADKAQKWIEAAAKDLAGAATGELDRGLIVAGRRQPPHVHALVAALNQAIRADGVTVKYATVDNIEEGPSKIADLTTALRSKQVDTLIMLGGNPAFSAPADIGFSEAIKLASTSIHFSSHVDETSQLCTWHVPRAHVLESWSDTQSEDGTAAVTQPLIAPMYGGKTDAEVLEHLVGGTRSGYDLVRNNWGGVLGAGMEKSWRRVLHDGVWAPKPAAPADDTAAPDAAGDPLGGDDDGTPTRTVKADAVAKADAKPPAGPFEVIFAPDPHAYDGRFANNGWLMELPDPIHKTTWMSVASISHATAQKLGVKDGDHIDVTVLGKTVTLPAAIAFGHADESVTLPVGLGRRFEGRVCKGVGVDCNAIRSTRGFYIAAGDVKKGSGFEQLATTQGHFVMEGRPLVREQTVAENEKDPNWARDLVKHPPLLNLFADWEYKAHKWGMTIDLGLCTGCNACVVACQAENNIPVIGVAGVLKSREMHWLRIDRYFAGKDGTVEAQDEANAVSMPMTCQHCENAPCEQVCPVLATTHSPEGINEMAYNRCIGTKYCGNNCPYKVRRFNYFAYDTEAHIPETHKLGLNPDVTVRSRGVMEKCTFCVQRVNQAKIAEKKERTPERQRAVIRGLQSACSQACPTEAIAFGDLNDPETRVARESNLGRSYKMLEEINVRPRISYLARITNPNPDLLPPKPDKPGGGHDPKDTHQEVKKTGGH